MRNTIGFAAALAPLLAFAQAAWAAPVALEFDDEAELAANGFAVDGDHTVAGGALELSPGATVSLVKPLGTWWTFVHHSRGFTVEAVLTVGPGLDSVVEAPFLTIDDGTAEVHVAVGAGSIGVSDDTGSNTSAVDAAGEHSVRVNSDGRLVTVYFDGALVLTSSTAFFEKEQAQSALSFGSGSQVTSTWSALRYDTFAFGRGDDDDDGDGVLNDEDLCSDTPVLPNEDRDGDRLGDACDSCPDDDGVDDDADGRCGEDDPCPTDPQDTDVDGDGVCDVDEGPGCGAGSGGPCSDPSGYPFYGCACAGPANAATGGFALAGLGLMGVVRRRRR